MSAALVHYRVSGKHFARRRASTVVVTRRESDTQEFMELARYTGAQLTRGTTGDDQQSIAFEANNSDVVNALNSNTVFLYVVNNASGRTSNMAYQGYNGDWWIAPANTAEVIEVPEPVNFSFDNVGNRVSMVDGLGRVDYEYDELSRLKSEKRQFDDVLNQAPLPSSSFKTIYEYNLNNSLKSITDPFGYQTSYAQDKTGKTLQVAGQIQFASNVKYRAWGGIKEVTSYGSVLQKLTYDDRLRVSDYEDTFASGINTKFAYGYQADGTLFKVGREYQGGQPAVETNFNRYYKFDHMGRMIAAMTGKKARGESAENCDVPFDLQYVYDKFGHVSTRNAWNRLTSETETDGTASYTNNRASIYFYDADGRTTGDKPAYSYVGVEIPGDIWGTASYNFNAAGMLRSSSGNSYTQELWQDGDGYNAKQKIWVLNPETGANEVRLTNYDIRSSVLGEVIAKADENGNRSESFVYGLGKKLGSFKRQTWHTGSTTQHQEFHLRQKSDPSGTYFASLGQAPDGSSQNDSAELTPENVDTSDAMAVACPYEPPPPPPPVDTYDGWRYSGFGRASEGMSCTIDGVEASCSTAMSMLANGSGYEVALGTAYFDLYNPQPDGSSGSHVGGGVLATGWMPIDSFGSSREAIASEAAARLASPTGSGLADDWRAQLGVSSASAEIGVINEGWQTELVSTVYGPADARLGSSSVTVRAVSTGISSSDLTQVSSEIDVSSIANGAVQTFLNENRLCAELAKKWNLAATQKEAKFIKPEAKEYNMTLGQLGFQKGDVPSLAMTLGDASDIGVALSNFRTNKIYLFRGALNPFFPDLKFLGETAFHELWHLRFDGDHEAIAKQLGLKYDVPPAGSGKTADDAAAEVIDAFFDDSHCGDRLTILQ